MAKFPMVFRPWKNGAFDYKRDDNDKIIPLIYKALEKSPTSKESPAIRKANFR
jgi:hypothetical protein